ncbi:MAG: hypothetical protein ACXWYD_10070 [Candidatus Binatia bacterium]
MDSIVCAKVDKSDYSAGGRMVKMEETYKDYMIPCTAALDRNSDTWKPIAQIMWSENGKKRVKLWMDWHFQLSFKNYSAAEKEAQLFARDWINNVTKSTST